MNDKRLKILTLILAGCCGIMLYITKIYNDRQAKADTKVTDTVVYESITTTVSEQPKTAKEALGITYKTENNTGCDLIQIKELNINGKIKLGTDVETLNYYVGQYEDCGEIGKGNLCLAAHSGEGDYIFNNLHKAEKGMLVNLITKDGTGYNYYITETFVIEPTEMWVTEDFHDDRVTMVTCTDNGEKRLVVIAKLMSESQYKTYSEVRSD